MQLFTNNADSELNGGITTGSLSLTLKTGGGAKFPSPTGGDFFLVTLFEKLGASEINHEIVKCTARSGDVLTVVRAQEGTTAKAFANADPVDLRVTAGTLLSKASLDSATFTGTVLGITAAMVGAPSGSGTSIGSNTGDQTSITGNAGTATALSLGSDRTKLDGIAAGATNYVHPASHPASIITQDTSNRFVTDAEKTAWNAKAASGANTDITSLASIASINGGQLAGMRNLVINGKMEIAQRGTSFSGLISSSVPTFPADRFAYGGGGHTAIATVSQQLDAPSNNEFQYSARLTITTADTVLAAGDSAEVSHQIEGTNARNLIGRTFTISFWVRSSKLGIHCLSLRNAGDSQSYISEYTVNAANTWEKKTLTVTGGLITGGTWNWTNGRGLLIGWSLMAGSNYHTTANVWQTGVFTATANQVNCLDTIGNIFAITGVQLEVGSVATPFEHRPYGMELDLCQRYYEVATHSPLFSGFVQTGNQHFFSTMYATPKRATPSVVSLTDVANAGFAAGSPTLQNSSSSGFSCSKIANGNFPNGFFQFNWTATAEL